MAEVKLERDTWERRCQASELENETLRGQIEEQKNMILIRNRQIIKKDDLLQRKDTFLRQDAKRKRKQRDLFSPNTHSNFDDPPTSRV